MKKYMVIDCCEREIGEPEFFDTMEKAQIHLFELFIKACRHIDVDNYNFCNISTMDELEEAIESLVDDDILDDENNFNDTSAWAETYNHDNWDGKIIEIDI